LYLDIVPPKFSRMKDFVVVEQEPRHSARPSGSQETLTCVKDRSARMRISWKPFRLIITYYSDSGGDAGGAVMRRCRMR